MKEKLSHSIVAALSVALLIITLGAAFGILSGRGAILGMVSASIICIITTLISGTKFGVSTPTGPMTAAVAVIFATDQAWLATHASEYSTTEILGLTLIVSAVILGILNLLKFHKVLKWVPNLVVSGFLNGVAALIVITQMNQLKQWQDALIMGATFLISIAFAKSKIKVQHPVAKLMFSSLYVIILMSIIVYVFGMDVTYLAIEDQRMIDIVGLHMPKFEWQLLWIVLPLAFELALVAFLDTLLTGVIMEKKTEVKTKYQKEMIGQSLSMAAVGFIAGLPGAQSTVPSMMLYKEGGNHKYTKVMLSIFTALIALLFIPLIQYVPLAVFAGIIFKIAYDVADFTSIKTIFLKRHALSIIVLLGTLASTVFLSVNLAVIGFTLFFVSWNWIMPKKLRITDLQSEKEEEGFIDEL